MPARKDKKTARTGPPRTVPASDVSETLKLDSQLGIHSIGSLKDSLVAALSSGNPISIDAGGVESIDTAALQLLVAFARHSGASSREITWLEISDAFSEATRLLDLEQHLGIESLAA